MLSMQIKNSDNSKNKRASNRGRDYWLELIAAWEKSGESKQAFCKRLDIRPGTFSHWRYILSKENKEKNMSHSSFMEVKVNGLLPESGMLPMPQLTVQLPMGIRVSLPAHIPIEQMKEIFHLLGIKCHA